MLCCLYTQEPPSMLTSMIAVDLNFCILPNVSVWHIAFKKQWWVDCSFVLHKRLYNSWNAIFYSESKHSVSLKSWVKWIFLSLKFFAFQELDKPLLVFYSTKLISKLKSWCQKVSLCSYHNCKSYFSVKFYSLEIKAGSTGL